MSRILAAVSRIVLLSILVAATGLFAQVDITAAPPEEPVYKVLFESGYYSQALDYIEARLPDAADSLWQQYQRYRAYCLILLDRREQARAVFIAILDRDATFSLDPIRTSPKIYEVYHQARLLWQERQPQPDTADSAAPTAALDTSRTDSASADTARGTVDLMTDSLMRSEPPLRRAPLYLLPFGVGQFANGQRTKGWVILGTQAACLAASVVSYVKRDDYYDPRYGWYEGNREPYEDYTLAFRIDFAGFALAYLYGVVDGFVVGRRRSVDRTRDEYQPVAGVGQ